MLRFNPFPHNQRDHTHSFDPSAVRDALDIGFGVLGKAFTSTSSLGPYDTTSATDFSVANIRAHSSRLYRVHLRGEVTVGGLAGSWRFNLTQDGTPVRRMGTAGTLLGSNITITLASLWLPDSGTYTLGIQAEEVSGLATIEFLAGAPREFWVEDIGRRR